MKPRDRNEFMLIVILLTTMIVTTMFFGCTKVSDALNVVQGTIPWKETKELAWGDKHPDWDKALNEAIVEAKFQENTKTPCEKVGLNDCVAQLISIMAKYESNFKPETSYNEGGHLQGVVSRGLLQISKDSANQSAYGCNITDAKQLHDPKTNLRCAVRILRFQSGKSGSLMGEPKKGCAAYWSVCRKSSGSNAKILKYMEGVK